MSDLVLLTADEVAAKLKIHVKTVYANRELPRIELGDGTVRWVEAQVDQWILTRQSRKAAPKKRVMRHKSNVVDIGGLTRKEMETAG